jgi:hypothetical protein
MRRTRQFCVADLRNILFSVFDQHSDDVDVYMNLGGGLALLANQLDVITGNLDPADDLSAMAQVMAMVATKVKSDAPITCSPVPSQKVSALIWRIRTKFAVECAIFFAQQNCYSINATHLLQDQVARVMLMEGCWEPLVQLFEDSLVGASLDVDLQGFDLQVVSRDPDGRGLDSSVRNAEGEVAVAEDEHVLDRQLSAESYSNLRSEADQHYWSEAEILMLIEEHLRPELNPFALHYSETVAGEEWLSLYDWLYRQDGQSLCRPVIRLSLR